MPAKRPRPWQPTTRSAALADSVRSAWAGRSHTTCSATGTSGYFSRQLARDSDSVCRACCRRRLASTLGSCRRAAISHACTALSASPRHEASSNAKPIACCDIATGATDTVALLRLSKAVVAAVIRDGESTVPGPRFELRPGYELLVVSDTATDHDIHTAFQ
jgi:hypothetical protein